MKEKLTKIETRAKAFCEVIAEYESMDFGIEWRRSRTWGSVAVILDNHNEKCSEASGCGYDKESACLAGLLVSFVRQQRIPEGLGFGQLRRPAKKTAGNLRRRPAVKLLTDTEYPKQFET